VIVRKPQLLMLSLAVTAVLTGCPQRQDTAAAPATTTTPAAETPAPAVELPPTAQFAITDLDTSKKVCDNLADFVNGVRLVYPMEKRAMRLLNLAGNKFFGMAFSWLIGQTIKDTLCGTKVLWRGDYQRLAANRAYFGEFDPFGDFDLLFGAAKMNLKIIDLPIRYRERTYGTTNIQRWRHGLLLLRMVLFAARRLKFV
jgi:hypothetical protein